jgi:hypothetical protein
LPDIKKFGFRRPVAVKVPTYSSVKNAVAGKNFLMGERKKNTVRLITAFGRLFMFVTEKWD